jgi:O-antigen ligase
MMLPDHRMDLSGPAVAGAQLLLVLWPIAVYLAAAEFITKTEQLQWLQKAMIVLALAQLITPLTPDTWSAYLGWVWTFGLFASPFALAATFGTRSWTARVFYLGVTLVPFVRGVQIGKAFLYFYVAAAVGTILWLRASRLVAVGAAAIAAVALATVVVAGDHVLTDPVDSLLAKEQKQMSYGGRSGRGQLALDALSIGQEAPILGVGPGNSYIYMLQRSPIGTPHNQYLNILVEFGLLGLTAWLVFLAVTFHTGLRIYRAATIPAHRTFALGWLGMFAGMVVGGVTGDFMIHSIRNGGLELFSGYYLQWVLLGGLVAVHRLEGGTRRTRVVVPALESRRFGRAASRPLVPAGPVATASRALS